MKKADFYPGPRLPKPDSLIEDDGLEGKFIRWFVGNFERMDWKRDAQRVFSALALVCNFDNVAHTSKLVLHQQLKMPKQSVYNNLKVLEREGAIIALETDYWMVDPSLVYCGPSKYHRRVRSTYRMLLNQKQKANHTENHERNDDEQCDLQARSGDPDPAPSDARAECA